MVNQLQKLPHKTKKEFKKSSQATPIGDNGASTLATMPSKKKKGNLTQP